MNVRKMSEKDKIREVIEYLHKGKDNFDICYIPTYLLDFLIEKLEKDLKNTEN